MSISFTLPSNPAALPGYALPPVSPQGTRIILLRHGRSTLNDAGCYQGSSDHSQLTVEGRLAARQVGQYLRHCPIDQIYTSSLQRAQQTVEELLPQLQGLRCPKGGLRPSHCPISLWQLREIDLPAWEGLRYEAVKTCFPDAYRCWQTTPEQFAMARKSTGKDAAYSSSESLLYPVREGYQRAQDFWTAIRPRHQGQTLLIVSHGGMIQALVNTALGLPMTQHHRLQQTHSGLTVLDFAVPALGTAHLHLLNLTTPIGERLPKLKAGKQGLRLVVLPCQTGGNCDGRRPPYRQSLGYANEHHTLATLVQGHPIAACVVEDHPRCLQSQRVLLAHHPETVTLSVGRTDFLHHWQQSVMRLLSQVSTSTLTTVAAVCQQAHAESFLQQLLGQSLTLLPNALTVVHYPGIAVRPIVQTLNARSVPINLN